MPSDVASGTGPGTSISRSSGTSVVTAIHLYPVKSCRRVEVSQAVVGAYGFCGDREWQLVGPDGRVLTQRTYPNLARVQPTLECGGLHLECDGLGGIDVLRPHAVCGEVDAFLASRVRLGDAGDQAARWFERLLGVPCRLMAIAIAPGYKRRLPPSLDVFGQEISLGDAAPIHIANEASHRYLLRRASEPFGIERFRANLIVRTDHPWEEDTWRTIRIADATVQVVFSWPRCAVPQVHQETGQRCREPARVLKRYRWCVDAPSLPDAWREIVSGSGLFGVSGAVGPQGAVISVGDHIDVLDSGEPLIPAPAR